MKIVIAMDSFKGSLTAPQACDAVREGFFAVLPAAEYSCVPMADGGEGTVACMASCAGAAGKGYETVPDLFGREKRAEYAVMSDGTVVLETAMTAGIADLKPEERNVLTASTFGVGAQIKSAVARGAKKIVIGFGGSATNDGGLGALQALGVVFYDAKGIQIPSGAGGEAMERVARADPEKTVDLSGVSFVFACDVTNPYCGKDGAAYVYAPQKGADPDTVVRLDRGLAHFGAVLESAFGRPILKTPGSGAAGGLCGGLLALTGAQIRSGFEVLSEAAGLESAVKNADLVITGEGKTDAQTAFGKLPCRVGRLGKKYGVPVLCVSGSVDSSARALYDEGITALFDTVPCPLSLDDAMKNAAGSLRFTCENIARLRKF